MRYTNWMAAFGLAVLSSSCLAVAAGAAAVVGYVQYDKNEAWQEFEADFDDAWQATTATIDELGYDASKSDSSDSTKRTLEGDDVRVRVVRYSGGKVRVSVRVGTFDTKDHRRRSELILEAISERL